MGLVLIVAVGGWYLLGQVEGPQEDEASLDKRLSGTLDSIESLAEDEAGLQQQFRELESAPEPETFPTRAEALDLSATMGTYVSERGLQISAFYTAQRTGEPDASGLPAIAYTLIIQGPADLLIGMMLLVDAVPAAVVQSLEFTRASEATDQWVMSLDMDVFYQEEGGQES